MKAGEPQDGSIPLSGIPETPVGRWVQPFARFFQIESASGVLLLACTVAALVLANSPWSSSVSLIFFIFLPGRSAATSALQAPQPGGDAAPATQSAVDNDQLQREDRCRDGGGQGAAVQEPPSALEDR
jgi:hypothetical protein